jgi:hypothetical protein
LSKIPFARLPKSWINKSGKQYDWTEVINLLRNREENMKDKAAGAIKQRTTILPPLDFSPAPTIASDRRKIFRDTVSTASSISLAEEHVSFSRELLSSRRVPVLPPKKGITEPPDEPFSVPSAFPPPLKDSASTRSGDTSNKQSGVVQNAPVEVITEPTDEPFPVPAEFPLPLKDSESTRSGDTSDKQSGVVRNGPVEVITELTYEPVPVPVGSIPPLPVRDSVSTRASDTSVKQLGVVQNNLPEVITEPTDEPVPVPDELSLPLKDSASTRSVDTSDKRPGVVQDGLVEVVTRAPTYDPVPVSAKSPLRLKDSASTRGGDASDKQTSLVQSGPGEGISLVEPKPEPPPVPAPAEFMLPPGAIELDLLDCDAIPTLIANVLRGTNVDEFLERLEVLAFTRTYSGFICTVD